MDPSGAVLHRWASEEKGETWVAFQERFPEAMPPFLNGWNHVELLEDGGLLAIGSHHSLLRIDRDSKILWKLDLAVRSEWRRLRLDRHDPHCRDRRRDRRVPGQPGGGDLE
jgi:hypothetical protein